MSQKRPRNQPPRSAPDSALSKLDPAYWEPRLFRSPYSYQGQMRRVRHWSVKIQFRGTRKTFSFPSAERRSAAVEACRLYQTIVKQGWEAATQLKSRRGQAGQPEPGDAAYWRQRLVHRQHSMGDQVCSGRELSARIEHEGTYHFFLLETDDRAAAADRAARIYRCVVNQGWPAANAQFRRELTVAYRWLDNPLLWTYTTIHTRPETQANASANTPDFAPEPSALPSAGIEIAIVEPDPGIRRALAWCLNRTQQFRCFLAGARVSEISPGLTQRAVRLVLLNQNLADKPESAKLDPPQPGSRPVATLRYSVSEDSEELFKTTPGGAPLYLLHRTPATQPLEPIHAVLSQQPLSPAEVVAAAWQHFKARLAALPSAGLERPLSQLTQREQEVLALLSKGHADKEIAGRLGISIHTVHEHVRNTFEKLGVHNRIEAVVKYLQK